MKHLTYLVYIYVQKEITRISYEYSAIQKSVKLLRKVNILIIYLKNENICLLMKNQ